MKGESRELLFAVRRHLHLAQLDGIETTSHRGAASAGGAAFAMQADVLFADPFAKFAGDFTMRIHWGNRIDVGLINVCGEDIVINNKGVTRVALSLDELFSDPMLGDTFFGPAFLVGLSAKEDTSWWGPEGFDAVVQEAPTGWLIEMRRVDTPRNGFSVAISQERFIRNIDHIVSGRTFMRYEFKYSPHVAC